jgi:hypothetical protein
LHKPETRVPFSEGFLNIPKMLWGYVEKLVELDRLVRANHPQSPRTRRGVSGAQASMGRAGTLSPPQQAQPRTCSSPPEEGNSEIPPLPLRPLKAILGRVDRASIGDGRRDARDQMRSGTARARTGALAGAAWCRERRSRARDTQGPGPRNPPSRLRRGCRAGSPRPGSSARGRGLPAV